MIAAYERFGAGPVRTAAGTAESRKRVRGFWHHCEATTPHNPGGRYLSRRGLPWLIGHEHIRYRLDAPHPSGQRLPALVCLVHDGDGDIAAVHRTFLDLAGGKAAIEPVKASIGSFAGGAVRLHMAAAELVVGEGLETTASAALLMGLPGWAGIACGNLGRNLMLPGIVRSVVIAADADPPGRRAAVAAARRWIAEGRSVRIAIPDAPGRDFNDIQQARIQAVEVMHG